MKMRLDYRVIGCCLLLCTLAALLFFKLLPAYGALKTARGDLVRTELEVDRLLRYRVRQFDESESMESPLTPDLPDIASLMAATRQARKATGIGPFSFETIQTEDHFLQDLVDEYGNPCQYLQSSVQLSFSSTLRQSAEFVDAIWESGVDGNTSTIRLSRRPDRPGQVSVSVLLEVHGIPR